MELLVFLTPNNSNIDFHQRDYVTCNTSTPIQTYNDGNTKVKLEHSGPYYFISGAEGHCEKGQKLIVVVISDKHDQLFKAVSPASAPSPIEFDGPAVAPTSSAAGLVNSSFLLALWVLAVFLVM
ncbi:early nodulin-like protein 15 [Forsythia ovata]|uniref:Early nodulin-like protein 15 n=1 Tax=Forsythia ovata TaxID=205694 RepID=A0ABD1WHK9_9LAMI